MQIPALTVQLANDVHPGIVPKLPGVGYTLTSGDGTTPLWALSGSAGIAPTLFYANQAARRAAALDVSMLYSIARQISDGSLWIVIPPLSGTTPVWGPLCAGPEVLGFAGDFGALVPGCVQYMRGDLGLGLTSTVVNSWANQVSGAGAASSMAEKTATVGIGSVGSGIGGRASVVTNGSSQAGTYSRTRAAPGTTPTFMYLISKQSRTSLGGSPQRVLSEIGTNNFLLYQDAASDHLRQFGDTSFQQVGSDITHVWARTALLFVGSTADRIKWGNLAEVTGTKVQNAAGGSSSLSFCFDSTSGTYNQGEFGLILEGTGVNAGNYAATLAALDAAADSWFTTGNVLF